ncbi:MAG: hypothetical protein KDI06_17780 [Calditrichaeota bacterium]|nr:hypothetical protein [Calditrichota bacterium]HQU71301.1 hypothetical protein [Calditrichia bacterium]
MSDFRGKPSAWLMYNSNGFPDFLFTILTYAMILLAFVALMWVTFGFLSFINAGSAKALAGVEVMDSLQTGLISIAGVVFGLAGSYTVRRFKKDEHYVEKKQVDFRIEQAEETPMPRISEEGLGLVVDEEDI